MRRVLLLSRRLTAYRAPFFSRLREALLAEGIELHVAYGSPDPGELDRGDAASLEWTLPTTERHVLGMSIVAPRLRELGKADLLIFPHENRFALNYPFLLIANRLRPPVALFGHGSNFLGRPEGLAADVRRWMARKPDWWFAYTKKSVADVRASGFPDDRITCVNNATDTAKLRALRAAVTDAERAAYREKWKVRGSTVGIHLGSLLPWKKIDLLFDYSDRIRDRVPGFELLVLGDGPLRDRVRTACRSRPWVHWAGRVSEREKAIASRLGCVLVNPGATGLVLVDGFALGLPTVTTLGPHPPEIAYLEDGRNGLITADDDEAFAAAVGRVLTDEELRGRMSSACVRDGERYSLEDMATRFATGVTWALDAGHRPLSSRVPRSVPHRAERLSSASAATSRFD